MYGKIKNVSKEDLQNIYGGPKNAKEGDSWNVWIVVKSKEETGKTDGDKELYWYYAVLQTVYAGDDYEQCEKEKIDNSEFKFKTTITYEEMSKGIAVQIGEEIVEETKGIWDFIKNMSINRFGTIINFLLELLRNVVDIFQIFANAITFNDSNLTYSRKDLEGNDKVNVQDFELSGKSYEGQKVINITKHSKSEKDGYEGFDEDTEIPVGLIDIYSLSVGDIDLLDVNFLNGTKTHKEDSSANKVWLFLRNVTSSIIHITIYVGLAALITVLIIDGIRIVTNSIQNPERRAEYMNALRRFAVAVIMLIGTIVIMAICIFASQYIFNNIQDENTEEYPIRVNVEEAGYSFSTNIAGYIRYMTEIKGVNRWLEKGMYTALYLVVSVCDFFMVFGMLLRTLAMWFFAILGPVIAILYAFEIEWPIRYETWLWFYVLLSLVQIIITIMCNFLLGII